MQGSFVPRIREIEKHNDQKMKKIEFLDRPIRVSGEELESFKDFSSVIDGHNAFKIKSDIFKKIWLGVVVGIGATVIGSVVFIFWPEEHKNLVSNQNEDETEYLEDDEKNSNVIVVDTLNITYKEKESFTRETEASPNQSQDESDNSILGVKPVTPEHQENDLEVMNDDVQPNQNEDSSNRFVNRQASPRVGIDSLYQYFETNLQYPDEAIQDSIQGELIVNFTILKTGEITDVKIQNSLGPLFDEEAKRLIVNMPAWDPAITNGKAVDSKISVPLTFRIVN